MAYAINKMHALHQPRRIKTVDDACKILDFVSEEERELIVVLHLSCGSITKGWHIAARGTMSHSSCESHEIFRKAIIHDSKFLIVGHNHPDEEVARFSKDDYQTAERLHEAGRTLEIPVLDFMLISKAGCISMKQEERIFSSKDSVMKCFHASRNKKANSYKRR
jgi:DNA repair protein RadC